MPAGYGLISWAYYQIALDVVHMLDYAGNPCNPDPKYNYDKCISEEVDKINREKYGCTSPYELDIDSICTNVTIAEKINKDWYEHGKAVQHYSSKTTCAHPCSYIRGTDICPIRRKFSTIPA